MAQTKGTSTKSKTATTSSKAAASKAAAKQKSSSAKSGNMSAAEKKQNAVTTRVNNNTVRGQNRSNIKYDGNHAYATYGAGLDDYRANTSNGGSSNTGAKSTKKNSTYGRANTSASATRVNSAAEKKAAAKATRYNNNTVRGQNRSNVKYDGNHAYVKAENKGMDDWRAYTSDGGSSNRGKSQNKTSTKK